MGNEESMGHHVLLANVNLRLSNDIGTIGYILF